MDNVQDEGLAINVYPNPVRHTLHIAIDDAARAQHYFLHDAAGRLVTDGRIGATNMVRVGNSLVTSINGAVNFTQVSDARFKRNVQDNVHGLDFVLKLRPVTYNYDVRALREQMKEGYERDKDGNMVKVSDPDTEAAIANKQGIRYTGFLAQEVEQAAKTAGFDFSGVDAPDNDGDLYGLRYAEFVVPLVKAVQEQQALIEELRREIELLKKR